MSKRIRRTAVVLAAILLPAAHAGQLSSASLPLSMDELLSYNGFMGGSSDCTSGGSYDAVSINLSLTGSCAETMLFNADGSMFSNVVLEASLSGQIDNDGAIVGSSFSLTGVIAGLGLDDPTLLATGTLVDAEYGPTAGSSTTLQTLIELDFLTSELAALGDLLYWSTNTDVQDWFDGDAWLVSADLAGNFTGSQYFFYDKSVSVRSPAPAALLSLGLLLLAAARRYPPRGAKRLAIV